MRKRTVVMSFVLVMALLLAACSPAAETEDAMMESTATMMDEMMDSTATPDAMMEETPIPMTGDGTPDAMMDETADAMMDETPDAMMDATATPDAMMGEMMDATATPDAMMGEHTPDAMMDETPDAMMDETPDAMMEETPGAEMMAPDWFTAEFTDQTSGETFTIADFKGKVVLVETFAQWCPTCLQQQRQVTELHEMLGMPADLVTVSLDVDPNEDAAMLEQYLAEHGFDWHFAIAPADVSREIGELYGAQFLNPPSAPMLIIDRKGEVHPLPFGVKSAEDLQEALEPYLNEGM